MKRVISLILSIAMVASLCTGLAVSSFALNEGDIFSNGNIKYKVTVSYGSREVNVTSNSYSGNIIIPSTATDNSSNDYSVTGIGYDAFKECNGLISVEMPSSIKSIGSSAFSGCTNLTSVTIPDNVTSIGISAFLNCKSLTNITIPNNVTSIKNGTFNGSGLISVAIGNNVTSIESSAFQDCASLKSVTIGSGMTSIGDYAFNNCAELTNINVYATNPPSLGIYVFDKSTNIEKICVPKDCVETYKEAAGWSAFAEIIEEIAGPITINGIDIEKVDKGEYGIGSLEVSDDGNTATIDSIYTNTDKEVEIYIPVGKTLVASPANTFAINVFGDLTITGGGKLETHPGNDSVAKGLRIDGKITIDGCLLETINCGIYADSKGIIIKGNSVVTTTSIYTDESNITITDSIVTVNGNDCGIYAPEGFINISSSEVTSRVAYGRGIQAKDVFIDVSLDKPVKIRNENVSGSIVFLPMEALYANRVFVGTELVTETNIENGTLDIDTKNSIYRIYNDNDGYVKIGAPSSGIKVNCELIDSIDVDNNNYGIGLLETSTDYKTVTIDKIDYNGAEDITIYIPSGRTLVVSNTDEYVIRVKNSSLNITGGGTLIAYNANVMTLGIHADKDITINGCAVEATGTYAIQAGNEGSLTIKGSSIITATSNGIAIYANNIMIEEDSIVTAESSLQDEQNPGVAIMGVSVITITNSTVTANAYGFGIMTEEGSIYISSDKPVKAKGGYAIAAIGQIFVGNELITEENIVNGTLDTEEFYAIATKDAGIDDGFVTIIMPVVQSGIKINDAPIEVCYSDYGASSPEVNGDTVIVDKIAYNGAEGITIYIPTGKTLTISQTDDDPYAQLIDSLQGNVTITGGGTLCLKANGEQCTTIVTHEGGINIIRCTVSINSIGGSSFGIFSQKCVSITDCPSVVISADTGIIAGGGMTEISDVAIENSVVEINGATGGGINATNVVISNSTVTATSKLNAGIYGTNGIDISNNSIVNAKGPYPIAANNVNGIKVNGNIISETNVRDYFNSEKDISFESLNGVAWFISGTDWVCCNAGAAEPGEPSGQITINGVDIEECIGSYGGEVIATGTNSVTVNKIYTNADVEINIPSDKKLFVYHTTNYSCIESNGLLKITGGGELECINEVSNYSAIHGMEGVIIDGCTVSATSLNSCAIKSDDGNITITDSEIYACGEGSNGFAISAEGSVLVSKSSILAFAKGDESNSINVGDSIFISNSSTIYASATEFGLLASSEINISKDSKVIIDVDANAYALVALKLVFDGDIPDETFFSGTDISINSSLTLTIDDDEETYNLLNIRSSSPVEIIFPVRLSFNSNVLTVKGADTYDYNAEGETPNSETSQTGDLQLVEGNFYTITASDKTFYVNYVVKDIEIKGNPNELAKDITDARQLIDKVVTKTNKYLTDSASGNVYTTEEAYNTFSQAITDAGTVKDDNTHTQLEIDGALLDLNGALRTFISTLRADTWYLSGNEVTHTDISDTDVFTESYAVLNTVTDATIYNSVKSTLLIKVGEKYSYSTSYVVYATSIDENAYSEYEKSQQTPHSPTDNPQPVDPPSPQPEVKPITIKYNDGKFDIVEVDLFDVRGIYYGYGSKGDLSETDYFGLNGFSECYALGNGTHTFKVLATNKSTGETKLYEDIEYTVTGLTDPVAVNQNGVVFINFENTPSKIYYEKDGKTIYVPIEKGLKLDADNFTEVTEITFDTKTVTIK